jgi:catechol 2,3-dioxygenase-like lactoylglutathione lyase family enzyme
MDRATPNRPSRDFDETERFYAGLGFEREWRDGGWMILSRGGLTLEFFPHPGLDPAGS